MNYNLYVGVDIAAASASIAVSRGAGVIEETFQIKQNEIGFQKMQERLSASDPAGVLVVMEVIGIYWVQPGDTIRCASRCILNPRDGAVCKLSPSDKGNLNQWQMIWRYFHERYNL